MKILMYHDIVAKTLTDIHSVTAQNLRQQLDWLRNHGYASYSLNEYWAFLKRGQMPQKGIVLTFDDGYEDNYITALPLLLEHGFTATIFLVSELVGRHSTWRDDQLASTRLLSWGQAQEMLALGMHFGSHTASHANLALADDHALHHELTTSRQQMQDKLGTRINTLSYPYSQFTPHVKHLVRQTGYEIGCTYEPWYVGAGGTDAFQLERIGILATDTIESFARKIRGDLRLRLNWRYRRWRARSSWVRRIKYALKPSRG